MKKCAIFKYALHLCTNDVLLNNFFILYRNRKEKLIKASGITMSSVVLIGVVVEFVCAGANLVRPSLGSCLWLR